VRSEAKAEILYIQLLYYIHQLHHRTAAAFPTVPHAQVFPAVRSLVFLSFTTHHMIFVLGDYGHVRNPLDNSRSNNNPRFVPRSPHAALTTDQASAHSASDKERANAKHVKPSFSARRVLDQPSTRSDTEGPDLITLSSSIMDLSLQCNTLSSPCECDMSRS
jgi:hypothetical protein